MQLGVNNSLFGKATSQRFARLAGAAAMAAVIGSSNAMADSGPGGGATAILPDLQVTGKTDLGIFYNFTIENKGKASATGVVFTAVVPTGATLLSADAFHFIGTSGGLFETLIDDVTGQRSFCGVSSIEGGPTTVSCRLGQINTFFTPNLTSELGRMDPGVVNVVELWVNPPTTPQIAVTTGTVVSDNGDSRLSNNTATVTVQVK